MRPIKLGGGSVAFQTQFIRSVIEAPSAEPRYVSSPTRTALATNQPGYVANVSIGRMTATEDDEVVGIRDDVCAERFPTSGQPANTSGTGSWLASSGLATPP
jgi:hypothetical protein